MFVSWSEFFIPATPATITDVSTTPLDLRRFCDNGYLRLFLLRTAVLPNSALNVPRSNVANILRSLLQSGEKLCLPVWPLALAAADSPAADLPAWETECSARKGGPLRKARFGLRARVWPAIGRSHSSSPYILAPTLDLARLQMHNSHRLAEPAALSRSRWSSDFPLLTQAVRSQEHIGPAGLSEKRFRPEVIKLARAFSTP
jgi:hypothetical protein